MNSTIFVCVGADAVYDDKVKDYFYCGCEKCSKKHKLDSKARKPKEEKEEKEVQ